MVGRCCWLYVISVSCKLRILIEHGYSQTHNVALARPVAEFTVSLSADGRVLSQGSVTDALNKSEILAKEVVDDEAARAEAERPTAESVPLPSKDAKPERSAGKLVAAEEIAVGHVGWDAGKQCVCSLVFVVC